MPGWMINIALVVHSDEALLAAGFIFIFHFFNTHFPLEKFPMDTVIFSGRISKTEMLHERQRWYNRLVAENWLEDYRVKDEWKKWKKVAHADSGVLPTPEAVEQARGYMVYARHYLEVIYPNTIPLKEELNPTLNMFAALGEYEPTTFTIYPLRDLEECMVTATGLRGPGTIPATNIDIRSVRYMLARPDYATLYKYLEVPDILDPVKPISLKKDVNPSIAATDDKLNSSTSGAIISL